MFPPWPSCLGGPGAPSRGPAVLIVATLRVRGKVTAPGQRRALPTPPGWALELLPPQMPRPARPGPARPGPEAWSEPLRKARAHLCGVRPAEARREHSTASPCPGEHAPECWGQPGAAGGQRPLPDCSCDESARRQGGCVSFSPPRRSGRLPRTLLVSTQAWTAGAVPRPSRE